MRRLKVRDTQHGELAAMPFLEEEERERLDLILNASVERGITSKVQRRAHDFLVRLGQRDSALRFLTDEERGQLVTLTKLDPPPAHDGKRKKKQKSKPKQQSSSMSAGEFVAVIGVVLSVAVAAYLTYHNPTTSGSAIWVGVWGVLCGGSFIGDTRRRSSTDQGSASPLEGFVVALIWAIASAAAVLLGSSHQLSPGWAALLSFVGAGIVGRAVLKVEDDDKDDDWDDWSDD